MALQKSQFQRLSEGPLPASWEACSLSKDFPALADFLCQEVWEDGSGRVTGTITLMLHEGVLKAAVNDRETSSSAFVSGKSLRGLLSTVNKGLMEGTLLFRRKPQASPNGRPRKG